MKKSELEHMLMEQGMLIKMLTKKCDRLEKEIEELERRVDAKNTIYNYPPIFDPTPICLGGGVTCGEVKGAIPSIK